MKRAIRSLGNRIQRLIDRIRGKRPDPVAPDPPEQPQPEQPPQVQAGLMEWIPGAPTILRLRADLAPRGYSLATAHGHLHVDPADPSHDAWMAANNHRPPHRIVDGWAEWTLPSSAEIERRALAFGRPSRAVVMVFHKTGRVPPDGDGLHVAFWVRPDRRYGEGHRAPVRNMDNQGWQVEL